MDYLTIENRDAWIVDRRPARNPLDPWRPYGFFAEVEPGPAGEAIPVNTVLLTNRECSFRCLMCDLWKNTREETVPSGAVAAQIRHALAQLPAAQQLKLYNAGSFFDPAAIPPLDYPEIATLCAPFERVVVECHPRVVGPRALRFRDLLTTASAGRTRLEVAMGLETADPLVLERLNKRMTLDDFRRAATTLQRAGIALRVFILVRPPWHNEAEGLEWARRSLEFAFDCGAETCSLIPTRGGNGALEVLAASGDYAPPALTSVEAAAEYGLSLRRGRVFVDLWDIDRAVACPACVGARLERLHAMNTTQRIPAQTECEVCA